MEHRLFAGDGYVLHCLKTPKFKTFSIAFRFSGAFLPETLNARAILPEILLDGTRTHPTRELLQARMDSLYGLSVSGGTEKIGRESVLSFDLKAVDGRFLPGDGSTLEGALDLLRQILFEPRLYRGRFRKKCLEEEVRLLREDFEAEYADKGEYAYTRFMALMFADELHRFRAKGVYETLGDLTAEDLALAHRQLFEGDHVTILAVGDFDPETVAAAVAARFSFRPASRVETWLDRETPAPRESRFLSESGEVRQARIHVGYRLDVRFGDPFYYAAVLLSAVFGEYDHSRLFRVLREENALCYYVNSSYDSNKGFLAVTAGTESSQAETALGLLDSVLRDLREGGITDAELALAKESVAKRIRQNADSPERLANLEFLCRRILGRGYFPETSLASLAAVRKEDVVALAGRLVPDFTYVLKGRDSA